MILITELPDHDELVIAVIKKIMPYGAFCSLPEYGNVEAFLHVSEVAPRWIKNIHEFISEGQKKRGPYIQQRDVRDIIIVSGLVQEWIADKHRHLRENPISYENDNVPYEVDDEYDDDGYKDSASYDYDGDK